MFVATGRECSRAPEERNLLSSSGARFLSVLIATNITLLAEPFRFIKPSPSCQLCSICFETPSTVFLGNDGPVRLAFSISFGSGNDIQYPPPPRISNS